MPDNDATSNSTPDLTLLGWREWLSLPQLELPLIAAKVDTGARTSCLHAFEVKPFEKDGQLWVRFGLHPIKDNNDVQIWREAQVLDQRTVTDSGGHQEQRYVIETELGLGKQTWPIEMTLTNRDNMRFRMLLGRTAMNSHCMVNPVSSWLLGEPSKQQLSAAKKAWRQESINP